MSGWTPGTNCSSILVVLPMAETTMTRLSSQWLLTIAAILRTAEALLTEAPPNLNTFIDMGITG